MKRSVQMKTSGIPSSITTVDRFKGFRGIGKPKREWEPGPVIIPAGALRKGVKYRVTANSIPRMTTELISPRVIKRSWFDRIIDRLFGYR